MLRLTALLCAALAAAGCQKDRPAETVPPELLESDEEQGDGLDESTRTAIQSSRKSELEPYPEEVRPPQAGDLERYVADLEGPGQLIAIIETSKGRISCRLYEDKTPITVANFVGLARGLKPFRDPATGEQVSKPFYDGLMFHRVIPRFMIQGGDPLGNGSGGPGYQFGLEIDPLARHDGPGTLAMANAGPETNGSQFYITEVARPELDDKYTVFGRCKNVGVVRDIARVETAAQNRPVEPVRIERVTVIRGTL